jgi:hypothetical protein
VLAASEQVPFGALDGALVVGELSLDGSVRHVRGVSSFGLYWSMHFHPKGANRFHSNWSTHFHQRRSTRFRPKGAKTALVKLLHLRHTPDSITNTKGRKHAWKKEGDHGYSRDFEATAGG